MYSKVKCCLRFNRDTCSSVSFSAVGLAFLFMYYPVLVEDSKIEATLKMLQQQYASYTPIEIPCQKDDYARVSFSAELEGQPLNFPKVQQWLKANKKWVKIGNESDGFFPELESSHH